MRRFRSTNTEEHSRVDAIYANASSHAAAGVSPSLALRLANFEKFTYPERLEGRRMRLLQLRPGQDHEVVSCDLMEVDLDERGYCFDAVSYTWGTDVRDKVILCDGKVLRVTSNLRAALRQFRKAGILTPLWVDAICINQDDTLEKAAQIKHMFSIYQRAETVHVWLGAAADDNQDEHRIQALHRLYGAVKRFLETTEEDAEPYVDFLGVESPYLDHPSNPEDDVDAVHALLTRDWFQRVWVVPELVTAHAVQFTLGPHTIDPKELLGVAYYSQIAKARGLTMTSKPAHHLQQGHGHACILANLRAQYQTGARFRLSELVRMTAAFKVTREKDRVFALVGIACDATAAFIDYTKDLRTIYLDIAHNALLGSGSGSGSSDVEGIDFLSRVTHQGSGGGANNLFSVSELSCMHNGGMQLEGYDDGVEMPEALRDKSMPSWAPVLSSYEAQRSAVVPLANVWPSTALSCAQRAEVSFGLGETLTVTGKLLTTPQTIIHEAPYEVSLHHIDADTTTRFEQMYEWIQTVEDLVCATQRHRKDRLDVPIVHTKWYENLSQAMAFDVSLSDSSSSSLSWSSSSPHLPSPPVSPLPPNYQTSFLSPPTSPIIQKDKITSPTSPSLHSKPSSTSLTRTHSHTSHTSQTSNSNSRQRQRQHTQRRRLLYFAFKLYIKIMSKGTFTNAFARAAEWATEGFAALTRESFVPLAEDELLKYARSFDTLSRGRRICVTAQGGIAWVPACARSSAGTATAAAVPKLARSTQSFRPALTYKSTAQGVMDTDDSEIAAAGGGDIIVKIRGLRVPLVLRPVTDVASGRVLGGRGSSSNGIGGSASSSGGDGEGSFLGSSAGGSSSSGGTSRSGSRRYGDSASSARWSTLYPSPVGSKIGALGGSGNTGGEMLDVVSAQRPNTALCPGSSASYIVLGDCYLQRYMFAESAEHRTVLPLPVRRFVLR